MKKILINAIFMISINIYSQSCPGNYNLGILTAQPVSNPSSKIGWHFIHQEEFDGATDIDNSFWNKWNGNWQNDMFFKPSNITINSGRCNLNVILEPGYYTDWTGTHYYYYTSSYMSSLKKFGPGYFWEMKGKRCGVGFKSSFWSYNYSTPLDPLNGEGISFFDNHFGSINDTRVNFSEVFGQNNGGVGCQENTIFNGFSGYGQVIPASNEADHTYSLDYQSNEVKMYIKMN